MARTPGRRRLAGDAQGLHLAATVAVKVGVVSLFDGAEARFRKFAVLEAHRGAGVGSTCCGGGGWLQARAPRIVRGARAETAAYYEKRGYAAAGALREVRGLRAYSCDRRLP